MSSILVQNIETFATITTHANMDAFDAWMDGNTEFGIVSLDADADGEYGYVALVAPLTEEDLITEDMNDAPAEEILAAIEAETTPVVVETEATITPAPAKPRKARKSKAKSKAQTTKSTPNKGAKMRNFEILAAFITATPGVSRTTVFSDAGLQASLRTPAQVKAIAKGDKAEVKRWNRRLNFLIREMRRQDVDIQIERKGRVAHYTIGKPSGQLELPFDDAAEARNATIIGDDANVVTEAITVDPKRAEEEPNQMMDFDALLATLDEEAVAPVEK
jgi:hypothetical protein